MARRFEIVLGRRPAIGGAPTGAPLTAWARVKLILAGSLLAVVVLAILTAAVILGSVLAVVLLVVFALALVVAIVRSAVRPPTRRSARDELDSGQSSPHSVDRER